MNKTLIEWALNPDGTPGYTLNSKTGCLNHTPEGLCLGGNFPCYAYRLANGRLRERYLANPNIAPSLMNINHILDSNYSRQSGYADPFYPRYWPERLKEPITKWSEWGRGKMIKHYQSPKGIFLDDMSDWMGDYWPEEWTKAELQMMRDCPQHRFYTLTKQPQNLIKFSPFPDNCWVGVTATNRELFQRLLATYGVEAKVKYISFEPLLEQIHLTANDLYGISQVIIGAQTKPYKPPKIEHVEEIVRAADKAGVKVFLKNNLVPLLAADPRPEKAKLFYSEMGLRQEVPE